MIIVTREQIYGLDVHSFENSHGDPYQLVFDPNQTDEYVEVTLVHLLGNSDCKYCNELRRTLTKIIQDFIIKSKKTVYFNIGLNKKADLRLLSKFARWMALAPKIKASAEITTLEDFQFIEFRLNINQEYISSLSVS